MANNKVKKPGWQMAVACTNPAIPSSGDPVRYGLATGVALGDEDAMGLTVVDFGPAVWRLNVTENIGGQVDPGDAVFLNAAATVISNTPTDFFFGIAAGTVLIGETTEIEVIHVPSPGAGALGAGSVGTAALAAGALAATAPGRAITAAGYFNAATVLDKFGADSFDAAAVLAVIEDDAIPEVKLAANSLTSTVVADSVADAEIPAVPVILRYDVPDMATGELDFDLDYDVLPLDVWIKKVDNNASAHAHTIQVQTVGGAANITNAISLNATPQYTIVRAGTVDEDAVVAGVNAVRIDVVRADGAGQVACEVYILAVRV